MRILRFLDAWRGGLRRRLREDCGQATVEFAVLTFAVVVGVGLGLVGFLPASLTAYDRYVAGFYLVLSLPVP